MIGLVLVTHGRLAVEFRSALEHVVGPQKQIEAITIGPDDDVDQSRNMIIEAVKRVDSGQGVAILTDMFGGTPSNLAISVMSHPKVEVLAGINLPMLIKLAKVRETCPLEQAVDRRAGRRPQILHHRQPRPDREMSDAMSDPGEDGAITRVVEIVNKKGLHARASAKFVQIAEKYRRRHHRDARQRNRRRHLDHGPDDAGGRDRHADHDQGQRAATRSTPCPTSATW